VQFEHQIHQTILEPLYLQGLDSQNSHQIQINKSMKSIKKCQSILRYLDKVNWH